MQDKKYFIYIATNRFNKVLYIGITNSLMRRQWEHENKIHPDSFTAKYQINKIVFYEIYGSPGAAIYREKELKGWLRQKKISLIESMNPTWNDLLLSS